MKLRLLIPYLLCALALAGCYRQTEEPFQQVDSAVVADVASPTSLASIVEVSDEGTPGQSGTGEGGAEITTRLPYITPETVPGQVEQPTPALPTPATVLAQTEAPLSITRFVLPSPTLTFEEELDPADPCVYSILPGDNLFRMSLDWATTVQEIMDLNQLESDALSIGQLVLIPGCQTSAPAATATVAPIIADSEPEAAESAAPTEAPDTTVEILDTPTLGPRIHVVSAGETLESISLLYRVDVNRIIEINNLANPDRLNVGQELLLPD